MLETEIKKLTTAVTELTAALHTVRLPAANSATAITPAPAAKTPETTQPATVASESEPAPAAEAPATAAPVEAEAKIAVPTKKQLVEKFIELAQEKDREVAIKLLADFGISKLPELTDKTKWADFIARCDALLA